MRTKPVLSLAGLFLAGVALSGCESCNCFGRRGATAGYDHSTAIGMNGTTSTTATAVAQGTVPTTPARAVTGATPTYTADPTAKPATMSGYTPAGQASNYGMPSSNVPAFTSPSTSGPATAGPPSSYTGSSSGTASSGITPAAAPSMSSGSLDGANRFTVPPSTGLPRSGASTGSGSSLTPNMAPPPPPVSSFSPGGSVPTLKNTNE